MKITVKQLRELIREVVEESKSSKKKSKKVDQNKDGVRNFKDVQIARRKASGMSHEDAVEDVG